MVDKNKIEQKLQELADYYEKNAPITNADSLYSGYSGILLFRLYFAAYKGKSDEILEEQMVDYLSNALQNEPNIATFANGFIGFAWFLNHIQSKNFVDLDEEIFELYDQLVYQSSLYFLEEKNHDFMHGALGGILYLSDRSLKSDFAKKSTDELLKLLIAQTTTTKNGMYWRVDASQLIQDEIGKDITYLHLSHGMASKIVVLTHCLKNGFSGVENTLRENIRFLIHSRDAETGLIPHRIVNGEKDIKTHSGWCRSNAGMGLAILQASHYFQDAEMKTEGIKIGLGSLKFIADNDLIPTDAGICHGRSGLSQMYKRYYQYTGEEAFTIAAEKWMHYTIEIAKFEDGICGFKNWHGFEQHWTNDNGFLLGTAGVGLSMLAYLSDEAMDWDSMILLS